MVGRADDGHGLECLVVEIDGATHRPDGSTYHITWSLGPGRRARESNELLRDKGWVISRHQSRLNCTPRVCDGRAPIVPRCRRRPCRLRSTAPANSLAQARRSSSPSTAGEHSGSSWQKRRASTLRCRRCRTRGSCSRRSSISSRRSLPGFRSAAGPLRKRWNGRPSISRACRSSHAWLATSTSTCIRRRAGRRSREAPRPL